MQCLFKGIDLGSHRVDLILEKFQWMPESWVTRTIFILCSKVKWQSYPFKDIKNLLTYGAQELVMYGPKFVTQVLNIVSNQNSKPCEQLLESCFHNPKVVTKTLMFYYSWT